MIDMGTKQNMEAAGGRAANSLPVQTRPPGVIPSEATPDKWLVGFPACSRDSAATWLYYLVDQEDSASQAEGKAARKAGAEIDPQCLQQPGRDMVEVHLLCVDGIGRRHLVRMS
ncbi:hypothetical protein [Streptomyces sp. NPDC051014]|uniref:hypothetical protein n=1 Tax=Streptomyces sp. NPDC051014 TaxID=3155751 RepID=UPI0033E621D1